MSPLRPQLALGISRPYPLRGPLTKTNLAQILRSAWARIETEGTHGPTIGHTGGRFFVIEIIVQV